MSTSQSFSSDQNMVIQLEVVPDDQEPADSADVGEVADDLFDVLEQSGQTVTPAPTGTRGGPLFDILLAVPRILNDNRDWLLPAIAPVLECLLIAREKLVKQEKGKQAPLKFTIEVNGKPVPIEAQDPKDAAKLIAELQLTQHDQVKIKARVPKKKRHA